MAEKDRDRSMANAEELLSAAGEGSDKGNDLGRTARAGGGTYAVALGILIASFLLAVQYVYPLRVPWQVVTVTCLYGLGVIGLALWYSRRRRATARGWGRRYSAALGVGIAFYAVGIAVGVSGDVTSPLFWLPYAALTAAPLIVAGVMRDRS